MNSSHTHITRFWTPFNIVDDHPATFIWELHPEDEISSLKITDSFQFTIPYDNMIYDITMCKVSKESYLVSSDLLSKYWVECVGLKALLFVIFLLSKRHNEVRVGLQESKQEIRHKFI